MSQGGVEAEIDLYDSDRANLARLVNWLNQRYVGEHKNPQKYAEELVERFHHEGFYVEVRMFTDEDYEGPDADMVWYPYVIITGRTDPEEEFDHDRMSHEVRSDLLGVNRQGNVQQKVVGQAGYGRTASGLIVPGGKAPV